MSALDYLPTPFLREKCQGWLTVVADEPVSSTLQRAYRAARADGEALYGEALWEAWHRACCAEGHPPYALRRDHGTESERFWARTVPFGDHLVWDGLRDWRGRPVFRVRTNHNRTLAQRYAWKQKHGPLSSRIDVWATCGLEHCLNAEHLASGWISRGGGGAHDKTPRSQIESRVRSLAEQLGHTPLSTEWDTSGYRPSRSALIRRYGSWADVLKAAGLE